MRPYRVVVLSPTFDKHLCLRQCVEDFSIQKLVAELVVNGLVVSVLPGAARFDEQGSDPDPSELGPDGFGRELRAVVGVGIGVGLVLALVPVAVFIAIRISGVLTESRKPER